MSEIRAGLISGFPASCESATRPGSLLQGHYVRCDNRSFFLLRGFPCLLDGDAGTRDCGVAADVFGRGRGRWVGF